MPKYRSDVTAYIIDHVNIVDLIGSSVNLKRSGRNYMGLCPFHGEKTPSFSVSADRQIYKCFGCGEAGNVISFAMKDGAMGFVEAIEWLADKYSLDLTPYIENNSNVGYDTKLLYEIMRESARFYFKNLMNDKVALSYFKKRNLSKEIIYQFGLGYSPNAWNSLHEHLKKKGFKETDMQLCGLVKPNKSNGYYDAFRNRVMFPIFDNMGRVCAFGGRVLDNSMPKYLNSPETPIFNKSKTLYGLNFVNKNYKGEDLILVEGYMDLISLNQYGIKNVVATLGTALNIGHIKLMKRNFKEIIFAFDGDKAGRNAIFRSLEAFEKSGLRVKVLELGEYKDPDEFIKRAGKSAFLAQVENALSEIDFKIKYIKADFDLEKSFDRMQFLNRIYDLVYHLHSDVEKEIYLERLSKLVRLDFDAVKRDYTNVAIKLSEGKSNKVKNSELVSEDLYVESFSHIPDNFAKNLEYDKEFMSLEDNGEFPDISELYDDEDAQFNTVYPSIDKVKGQFNLFAALSAQNPLLKPNSQIDMVEKLMLKYAIQSIGNFYYISEKNIEFKIYENKLAYAVLEEYYQRFESLSISNLLSLFDIAYVELLKRISAIALPITQENPLDVLINRHSFHSLEIDVFNIDIEIRQLQLEVDMESSVKLRLKLSQRVEFTKKMLALKKR